MTLDSYLELNKLTPTEFARLCETSPSTITRLLAHERVPGFDLLTKICRVTSGAVTPNDFLPLEIRPSSFGAAA